MLGLQPGETNPDSNLTSLRWARVHWAFSPEKISRLQSQCVALGKSMPGLQPGEDIKTPISVRCVGPEYIGPSARGIHPDSNLSALLGQEYAGLQPREESRFQSHCVALGQSTLGLQPGETNPDSNLSALLWQEYAGLQPVERCKELAAKRQFKSFFPCSLFIFLDHFFIVHCSLLSFAFCLLSFVFYLLSFIFCLLSCHFCLIT